MSVLLILIAAHLSGVFCNDPSNNEESIEPQPPRFIVEPPHRLLLNSSRGASINCTVYGLPAPILDWVREVDGAVLPVDDILGVIKILPNNTLYFPPFPDGGLHPTIHNGRFRCQASNKVGTILSRQLKVSTVVPSHYKQYTASVNDVFVNRGNTAVFKCVINPYYVRNYVRVTSWSRANMAIISGDDISILQSGDLHLRHVTEEDKNVSYRCTTYNIITGEMKTSGPAHLHLNDAVHSAPQMRSSMQLVSAALGESIELPCVASGYPLPVYSWTKNGEPTEDSRRGGNLLLTRLAITDGGNYQCTARNNLGSVQASTQLVVKAPVTTVIEPNKQTIDSGDDVTFKCTISGSPIRYVRWYKDGEPAETSDRVVIADNNRLTITGVTNRDRGLYQCVAGSDDEESQASVQLVIGVAAPHLFHTFSTAFSSPGQDVSLQCAASGNPSPSIIWSLDDGPIPLGDRFQVTHDRRDNGDVMSRVNISDIEVRDGGLYECRAVNDAGMDHSRAKLHVYGVPYIRHMSNMTVVAMEILKIPCFVSGYPINSVKWLRGDDVLPINHRQQVTRDAILIITNVVKTDAGRYTCFAENEQGQGMRRAVFVEVIEPPQIDSFNFPKRRQGERISVTCVASKGDLPIQIHWLFNGQPVNADTGVSTRQIGPYTSQLSIGNVRSYHSGNYTCTATNRAATATYTTQLHVNVAPEWLVEPTDGFVVAGGAIILDCLTRGDPTPTVEWSKSRGLAPWNYSLVSESSRVEVLANSSLRINSVQVSDQGYYLCFSSNGIGSGLSKVVFITVHIPARFIPGDEAYTIRAGHNISMECAAMGDHPLSVAWNFNGGGLDFSPRGRLSVVYTDTPTGRKSTLTIAPVSGDDSGFYFCNAKNLFGSDARRIRLLVTEAPWRVDGLIVLTGGSRSVLLLWQPPFNGNSALSSYTIKYRQCSGTAMRREMNLTVSSNETKVLVSGLLPAHLYEFTVMAHNEIGTSPPSNVLNVTTEEDVPSGVPQNVNAVGVTATALSITWTEPRIEEQNGDILGYYIGYKISNASSPYTPITVTSDLISVNANGQNEYVLDELHKFTKYSIYIQAFNSKGAGPRSRDLLALTLEDVPSAAPSGVQARAQNSQTIEVTWSPPPLTSLHGILQGYRVFYSPVTSDEDESDAQVTDSQKVSVVLTGLLKFTNYSIQVLAYTRRGHGVRSAPVYTATQPDVPEKPADIVAAAAGPSSVMVAWKPPLHANGKIIQYTVVIQDRTSQQALGQSISVDGNLERHLVTNLSVNHQYSVQVDASTIKGRGDPTREVMVTTHSQVAASILSFSSSIIAQHHSSVILPCVAVGRPTPSITWKRSGRRLELDDGMVISADGSLVINSVDTSHVANYTCRAENRHGAEEVYYSLNVQAPPKQPQLAVAITTKSSVQVSWRSGSNGGSVIKGFWLVYYEELYRDDKKTIKLSSTSRSFTAPNLLCGSKYIFQVFAFNSVGNGSRSDKLYVSTNGSAPIAPPQSLILSDLNSTFIDLDLSSWQTGGCPVNWYDVEVQNWNENYWQEIELRIASNVTIYRVTLHPETWYRVRVTAHNDAGSTECILPFSTHPYSTSGTVKPLHVVHRYEKPFYRQPYVILPICAALVLFIIIMTAVILERKRRKMRFKYKQDNACNIRRDLTTETSLISDTDKSTGQELAVSNIYSLQPGPRTDAAHDSESPSSDGSGREEEEYYSALSASNAHSKPDCTQDSDYEQRQSTSSFANKSSRVIEDDHLPHKLPPPPIPARSFSNNAGQRMSMVSTVSSTHDELFHALGGSSYGNEPPSERESAQSNLTEASLRHFTQSPARPNEARQAVCEVAHYGGPSPDGSQTPNDSVFYHSHNREGLSHNINTGSVKPLNNKSSHLAHIDEDDPLIQAKSGTDRCDNPSQSTRFCPVQGSDQKKSNVSTQQTANYTAETNYTGETTVV